MAIYVEKVPKCMSKQLILIASSFLIFLVNFFVSPSKTLLIPDNIWILTLSQILRGLIYPISIVLSFPEMIDVAISLYPKSER